jgi:hypothetical protein
MPFPQRGVAPDAGAAVSAAEQEEMRRSTVAWARFRIARVRIVISSIRASTELR